MWPTFVCLFVLLVAVNAAQVNVEVGASGAGSKVCVIPADGSKGCTGKAHWNFLQGTAVDEGNDLGMRGRCDLDCCKSACERLPNCLSFAISRELCFLKDKCISAGTPSKKSPYVTFYVSCTKRRNGDKVVSMELPPDLSASEVAKGKDERTKAYDALNAFRGPLPPDNQRERLFMVGDVWEQIAEGSSSFMGLLVLAEQLGRTTVLPYLNNPPSEDTASLFAGWRTETNTPFDSVFSIQAYKKCFPKNKLLLADDAWDRLQPKTDEDGKILSGSLGGGTLGIYWEYNVERQTGKKSITGITDCTSKMNGRDRFWQTYTKLFEQMHFDRVLCIANDLMERFTVEELLSNEKGYLGGYQTIVFLNWLVVLPARRPLAVPPQTYGLFLTATLTPTGVASAWRLTAFVSVSGKVGGV